MNDATTRTASVQNEGEAPVVLGTASAIDTSSASDIAPATRFNPAGAPEQVTDIDPGHPAVDNNPRAGTTINQNKTDFNDPTLSGSDAVAEHLGMKTQAQAEAEQAKAAKKN